MISWLKDLALWPYRAWYFWRHPLKTGPSIISHVRTWDRALTREEVEAELNADPTDAGEGK